MGGIASRWTAAIAVAALLVAACVLPNYTKQGDQAAAKGDWKSAVRYYGKALEEDPSSADAKKKYDDAKVHAIDEAVAIAKRCQAENDVACIERETSYVLSLDPAHAEAGQLRTEARRAKARALVQDAKQQATRAEYLQAVRTLAGVRQLTSDPEVLAEVNGVSQGMAQAAVAYVATMLQEASRADVERQVQMYGECIEILSEVVQWAPEGVDLLAQAKARHQTASAELQKRQQQQQQAQQEEARRQQAAQDRRNADMHRTVTVVGAVLAPGKSDHTNWDGPGKVGPEVVRSVAVALAGTNPYTAVIGILSGPALSAMEKPDVAGIAQLYVNGQPGDARELPKNQDSYTPQWQAQFYNVDIQTTRVRVVLKEMDVMEDDPVGTIEIGPAELGQAVDAAQVFPVRVDGQSNGQILFVSISVQ